MAKDLDETHMNHLLLIRKDVHHEMKAIAAVKCSPNIAAEYEQAAIEHIKRFREKRQKPIE